MALLVQRDPESLFFFVVLFLFFATLLGVAHAEGLSLWWLALLGGALWQGGKERSMGYPSEPDLMRRLEAESVKERSELDKTIGAPQNHRKSIMRL